MFPSQAWFLILVTAYCWVMLKKCQTTKTPPIKEFIVYYTATKAS